MKRPFELTPEVKKLADAAIDKLVFALKEKDFEQGLKVGGIDWDVYRVRFDNGRRAFLALRMTPEGVPMVGAINVTIEKVETSLQEQTN